MLSMCLYRALAKMSWAGNFVNSGHCESLTGLVKRQKRLCQRNVELMDSVQTGAKMAIEECQVQFKNRRWNCSTANSNRLFGKVILRQGNLSKKEFKQNCNGRILDIQSKIVLVV